jgi:hypothetical protein
VGPFSEHADEMCQSDQAKNYAGDYDISLHRNRLPG